jgi:hypothetical protein
MWCCCPASHHGPGNRLLFRWDRPTADGVGDLPEGRISRVNGHPTVPRPDETAKWPSRQRWSLRRNLTRGEVLAISALSLDNEFRRGDKFALIP